MANDKRIVNDGTALLDGEFVSAARRISAAHDETSEALAAIWNAIKEKGSCPFCGHSGPVESLGDHWMAGWRGPEDKGCPLLIVMYDHFDALGLK